MFKRLFRRYIQSNISVINMKTRTWLIALATSAIIAVASIVGIFIYIKSSEIRTLKIASTSSLNDTGLLDAFEDAFEPKYGIDLHFLSTGSGIAMQNGKRGIVDLILVHDPKAESSFIQDGYGVCRKIIAYNFFAIVGPQTDPAKIQNSTPIQAMTRILEAGRNGIALWVSRADLSGTHSKEKSLWTTAGFNWSDIRNEVGWYKEVGQQMGQTLLMTYNMKIGGVPAAYTLTDMGTYLMFTKEGRINLPIIVGQGQELLNVYSVIAVSNTKYANVSFENAIKFIKYSISDEGQQLISNYGKEAYGQSLFFGAVNLLKNNTDPTLAEWIRNYAFLNGSECPLEYRDGHPELYS